MGDLHSGNAHFTVENQPTLFYFDQCGYDWRAFYIAKFLHSVIQHKISSKTKLITQCHCVRRRRSRRVWSGSGMTQSQGFETTLFHL